MKEGSASAFLAVLAATGVVVAQQVDIPLRNWTVPPYISSSTGGITTMTDITAPRLFVGVQPCRLVDTRNAAGPYGGPALATNVARTFDIDNGPCGIPAGVEAYSLNFGAILPPADGFLTAWPTGTAQPTISQLNFIGGKVVANAAVVPVGSNGAINVLVNAGPTDIYIDINGYFSDTLGDPGNYLQLINNSTQQTAFFDNNSGVCSGACGVYAETSSGHAIYGAALSPLPGSVGVFGFSDFYNGVWAESTNQDGLAAFGGRDGGYLQGARHGVIGVSSATSGVTYGIVGATGSVGFGSAGVLGSDGSGIPLGVLETIPAGVRGQSNVGAGVLGLSQDRGVAGVLLNSGGMLVAEGDLGLAGYGVYSFGDYAGTGAKYFIEPHPTDASKVIRYIALEGGEPGTYFRGRAKFERGMARITVPEDFRLVTDDEGLSVQITPIGAMATVAVLRADLNEVVVQSSRNVEFYYLVNGVRRTHRDLTNPIAEGNEYMPRFPEERMPLAYTEGQRRLLMQNGTYNADGTVNMETARRLGWDRKWGQRARPQPRPEQPANP